MRRHLLITISAAAIACSSPEADPAPDGGANEDASNDHGTSALDASMGADIGSPSDTGQPEDTSSPPDASADVGADASAPDLGPMPRAIGPRPVTPTPVARGTLFAAPDGSGTDCTEASPCDIYEVTGQAMAGDVVFLRGGTYSIAQNLNFRGRGTDPGPPLYESYPGEVAVLDGAGLGPGDDVYIRVLGDPVILRLFEVRNMPKAGIAVRTSDNVLEGLTVYANLLSGIHVHESYEVPSSNNNLITDCTVYDNSGAGLGGAEYADGGNSDGISMSSGIGNRIENCLVYGNSDDGVDTWRTTDSYVGFSISHNNGIASGNGQGFKAGGAPPSAGTVIEHSISYSNLSAGFDQNSGVNVTFSYNTSWDNGRGYWFGDDTTGDHNVAFETNFANMAGTQDDNSWQRAGTPVPLATDPMSADFLVPSAGFEDLGAHANR